MPSQTACLTGFKNLRDICFRGANSPADLQFIQLHVLRAEIEMRPAHSISLQWDAPLPPQVAVKQPIDIRAESHYLVAADALLTRQVRQHPPRQSNMRRRGGACVVRPRSRGSPAVDRCANPNCSKRLHYLREGRIFTFEIPDPRGPVIRKMEDRLLSSVLGVGGRFSRESEVTMKSRPAGVRSRLFGQWKASHPQLVCFRNRPGTKRINLIFICFSGNRRVRRCH